jgi:lipoteichoic acid synthase
MRFLTLTLLALSLKFLLLASWTASGLGFFPIVSSISIICLLAIPAMWFPNKWRSIYLLILNVLISILLFSDQLFFTMYKSFITIPVLVQAGQLMGVSQSIANLFSFGYLLYFVDIIPFIWLMLRQKNNTDEIKQSKKKWIRSLVLTSLLFLMISFFQARTAYGADLLRQGSSVLASMGLLSYHLADLVSFNQNVGGNTAISQVKVWMDVHRNQEKQNLIGAVKGKNLIIIQMEAMQEFVINRKIGDQEITPNLNRLMKTSMYFPNYFTQIAQGTTSDAEFMSLNSLYPLSSGAAYILKAGNTYQALPKLMKDNGYHTFALHAFNPDYWNRNNMYPKLGFEQFISAGQYVIPAEEVYGLGLSDEQFFKQSLVKLKQLPKPFFSFLITLSGHHPYVLPEAQKELKLPSDFSQMFSNYIQAQHYADKSLGHFIDGLQQEGLLNNSLLVIYGDHFGPELNDGEILKLVDPADAAHNNSAELHKVPLFIHFPDQGHTGIQSAAGGQMDLFPTIANLMGITKSHMAYLGRDMLNSNQSFVVFRQFLPEGSFVNNQVFYLANMDKLFKHGICYDRAHNDAVLQVDRCRSGFDSANWQLKASDAVLDQNAIPQLITTK